MNVYAYIGVFLKLSIGTAYYMINKMITQTCTYGLEDNAQVVLLPKAKTNCPAGMTPFEKPFFVSTVVFASMSLAIVYFFFFRRGGGDSPTYSKHMVLLMFIPSILECVAFCIGQYAQILMALSLSMLMKGVKVVFSAIFTATFPRRKQYAFHWFSVGLCIAGLAVAGGSEYLNNPDSAWAVILGSVLLLAAECMKAFRVIYDEMMMKKHQCEVLFVVGMEGLYSIAFLIPTIFLAWLAIPGSDNSSLEDLADSFHRISQSDLLTVLFTILPFIVVVLAVAGVLIIKYLTGVHNALISVSRSIVVWVLELIFFYCAPADFAKTYGKPWGMFSVLRLCGFIMVILATLMYDEDICFPRFFYYPAKELEGDIIVEVEPDEQKQLSSKL